MNSAILQRLKTKPIHVPMEPVIRCPKCKSIDLRDVDKKPVSLGSAVVKDFKLLGAMLASDFGHIRELYHCDCCGIDFCWEHKNGLHWLSTSVKDGLQLVEVGVSGCFESCVHLCQCGGHVVRSFRDVKDTRDVGMIAYVAATKVASGAAKNEFRIFFSCSKCKWRIESDSTFYQGDACDSRPTKLCAVASKRS